MNAWSSQDFTAENGTYFNSGYNGKCLFGYFHISYYETEKTAITLGSLNNYMAD